MVIGMRVLALLLNVLPLFVGQQLESAALGLTLPMSGISSESDADSGSNEEDDLTSFTVVDAFTSATYPGQKGKKGGNTAMVFSMAGMP